MFQTPAEVEGVNNLKTWHTIVMVKVWMTWEGTMFGKYKDQSVKMVTGD
jgi:hypothetical protein